MLFQIHQPTRDGMNMQHKPLPAHDLVLFLNERMHSVVPQVQNGHS
jgi:hypothetical protein